ncbi:MAG: UvrD-helicase domain-containing protein, partial [Pseudomonadota bacterium]|nr:UvrD-helicase domain-containing protein [Pseudomonadota bacterium]
MEDEKLLKELNDAQRRAVRSDSSQALILAGAGSGKTKVLVHRIAWYLHTGQSLDQGILAVTFTNKAASEMRFRIQRLINRSVDAMWVGTFHGIAHRLLRLHWKDAKLNESFQIIDSD